MSAPTIRAELATAIRAVNAAFDHLPKSAQDAIEIGFDGLEAEVDAAIVADDRPRALRAITAWRRHWLATFEEVAL